MIRNILRYSLKYPNKYLNVNIVGFLNIIKAIKNKKVELKKNNNININHFINNNDEDINTLAVDLISNQHSISENWQERHNIFTVRENEKMKKTTEKAILSLKKCHVDLQINELQHQISKGEIDNHDIKKLSNLTKIKTHIAKTLGRNIG